MKQKVLKLMCLLCVCMMGASAWADDVDYKTITFSSSTNSKGVSSYTGTFNTTVDEFTVEVTNFNNNNNGWDYVRCGSKSAASTATIITSSPIDRVITKVVVTIDEVTATSVNSTTLYVSSNKSTWTEVASPTIAKGELTYSVPNANQAANLYYKLEYACKKSSNGVVQLSKVQYYAATVSADPAVPSITVATTSVNVESAGAEGTIDVTYNNVDEESEIVFYEADGTTTATYDWITASINSDGNIEYLVEENDGDARTAYFKVYGLDGDAKDVYSDLITVTQAAYVAPPAGNFFVKVTSTEDITDGAYLIVYEDGNVAFNGGLKKLDVTSNTVSVTISNDAIAASDEMKAAAFLIDVTSGTLTTQGSIYVGKTADSNGLDEKTTAMTNTFSIDDDGNLVVKSSGGAYLRYNSGQTDQRFRYYKSATYTGQKAIQLYKLVTLKDELSVSASTYATYYNSEYAYTMPKGLEGYVIAAATDGALTPKLAYSAGDVVPAGVALVLKGNEGSYDLVYTADAGEETPDANLLKGTDEAALTTGGDKYYMLSYDENGKNVGFYWGAADGGAFTCAAHKAYLALTDVQAAGVKGFRFDAEESTGINGLTPAINEGNGAIYNLAGQRMETLQKGINIVGGKKVIIK